MSNPAGRNPYSRVYEYRALDPADKRVWISWATGYDPPHPAPGSKAWQWMNEVETVLDWSLCPATEFTAPTAAKVAALVRKIRREQGFEVLPGRIHVAPPGLPLPLVLGGVSYRSTREASRITGIPRTTLLRKVGLYR